jgi:predicted Co/Zn/Cd cation transporter (cation efflux family)
MLPGCILVRSKRRGITVGIGVGEIVIILMGVGAVVGIPLGVLYLLKSRRG